MTQEDDELVKREYLFVSVDLLRKILKYNPDTNELFWKHRPIEMFPSPRHQKMWNTRFAGKKAFTSENGRGYLKGSILNQMLMKHRVIWAMHYGEWPAKNIDHINGNTIDNRITNLRLADESANAKNKKIPNTNTSGMIGISWDSSCEKWRVRIGVDYKMVFVGSFKTKETAIAARKSAETKYGFHPNHGRS